MSSIKICRITFSCKSQGQAKFSFLTGSRLWFLNIAFGYGAITFANNLREEKNENNETKIILMAIFSFAIHGFDFFVISPKKPCP